MFKKSQNIYWLLFFITIIMSFSYALIYPSMGIDDEIFPLQCELSSILLGNRLGLLSTIKFIHTYEYIPIWRDFIAIMIYVVGLVIHVDNFRRYILNEIFDEKASTIFACTSISFPFFAFAFIFMIMSIEHSLVMLLSAIGVDFLYKYFTEQNKKYLLFSLFFVFLSSSFYEFGLLYFLIATVIVELFNLLDVEKLNIYTPIKHIFISVVIAVLSFLFNVGIVKLFQQDEYIRAKEFFTYNTESIQAFFISAKEVILSFIHNFITTASYNFGSLISIISIFIILSTCFIFSVKKKNFIIFLLAIVLVVLPFTPILLTGYEWPYRAYSTLCFVDAFSFVILYYLVKEKKILKYILYACVFVVVLYQTKEMNQIFYTEHLKFNNDKMFAFSIQKDIATLGYDKIPVIFVGTRDNLKLQNEYYIDAAEINISTFNWDRYNEWESELIAPRIFSFMQQQSIDINPFYIPIDRIDEYKENIQKQIKDMNVYPQKNSIKNCGEYVLVKIGPSLLDEE